MRRNQKFKPPPVELTAAEIEAEIRDSAAQIWSQHMRSWYLRLVARSQHVPGHSAPVSLARKKLAKNQVPKSKPRRCQ